jgi:hypothetical protein
MIPKMQKTRGRSSTNTPDEACRDRKIYPERLMASSTILFVHRSDLQENNRTDYDGKMAVTSAR